MKKENLFIAVIVGGYDVQAWQYALIEKISVNNLIQFIINDNKVKDSVVNSIDKLLLGFNSAITKLISKIPVLRMSIGNNDNALEYKNILGINKDVKVYKLSSLLAINKGSFTLIKAKDIPRNDTYDIIIDFTKTDSLEEIISYATYGVWQYEHGVQEQNAPINCGIYESLMKISNTSFSIKMYLKDEEEKINEYLIYKESLCTHILPVCNMNNLLWASVHAIPEKIEAVKFMGIDEFTKRVKLDSIDGKCRESSLRRTSFFSQLKYLNNYTRYVQQAISNKLFYYQWSIIISYNQDNRRRIMQVVPELDRFWADPFVIIEEERTYIFVEEEIREIGKGHISVITLNNEGEVEKVTPIIVNDYHMSYPYVFKFNEKTYMIPESCQDNSIKLYVCNKLPDEWSFVKTIIVGIRGVDTSVIYFDGLWWLFCSEYTSDEKQNRLLKLFYSEDLFSDKWIAHPHNPIVSQVDGARNAGRIFLHKGVLIRPAQVCSKGYGQGIKLYKIVKLNKNEYEEKEIYMMDSDVIKNVCGIHTINSDNGVTVIDVLKRIPKFSRSNKLSYIKPTELRSINDKLTDIKQKYIYDND